VGFLIYDNALLFSIYDARTAVDWGEYCYIAIVTISGNDEARRAVIKNSHETHKAHNSNIDSAQKPSKYF
jgi:hypothetical protein